MTIKRRNGSEEDEIKKLRMCVCESEKERSCANKRLTREMTRGMKSARGAEEVRNKNHVLYKCAECPRTVGTCLGTDREEGSSEKTFTLNLTLEAKYPVFEIVSVSMNLS